MGNVFTPPECDVKMGDVSNPNILINVNFDVNQREQNFYDVTVTSPRTFDRWAVSVPAGENRCRISKGKQDGFNTIIKTVTSYQDGWLGNLFQQIEADVDGTYSFAGDEVTFSCVVKTQTDYHCVYIGYQPKEGAYQFEVEPIPPSTVFTNYKITRKLPLGISNVQVGIGYSRPQPSDALGHVLEMGKPKFEVSEVQTRYNQPTYAEELRKCKRYYDTILIHGTLGYNSKYIGVSVPVEPKRINGTLTFKSVYNKVINKVSVQTNVDGVLDFGVEGGGISLLKLTTSSDWSILVVDCILDKMPPSTASWYRIHVIVDSEI